jgi:hypothetical protein
VLQVALICQNLREYNSISDCIVVQALFYFSNSRISTLISFREIANIISVTPQIATVARSKSRELTSVRMQRQSALRIRAA